MGCEMQENTDNTSTSQAGVAFDEYQNQRALLRYSVENLDLPTRLFIRFCVFLIKEKRRGRGRALSVEQTRRTDQIDVQISSSSFRSQIIIIIRVFFPPTDLLCIN